MGTIVSHIYDMIKEHGSEQAYLEFLTKTGSTMNGLDLIQNERREQIEKHKFTVTRDKIVNANGQLVEAALFCLAPRDNKWPREWDTKYRDKILKKQPLERLKVAGAFYFAENARLGYGKYYQAVLDIAKQMDEIIAKLKEQQ